jgi:Protein of unknown function (DUF4232)
VFLVGCVVSCGALVALAGLSKVYRGARRMDGYSAIWRALRIPRRLVPRAELAVGGVECLTGAAVCTRIYPAAAGAAMALLGAAFCALLGYVRANRVPGGCGCMRWRRRADAAVTWRAVVRAATLVAAGIADACFTAPSGGIAMFQRAWFYAGVLTAGVVLMLLSTQATVRTPRCHRPLWSSVRASMRALTRHGVFAAMDSAAGPFGSDVTYRRTGCTDEFWFPAAGGDGAVVFQVSYTAAGVLTVHAQRAERHLSTNLAARLTVVECTRSRTAGGEAMRINRAAASALTAGFCLLTITACASQQATGAPSAPAASSGTGTTSADGSVLTAGAAAGDGLAACATAQLKIALTSTGALAGQAGGYLRFTNDSHSACRLTGWPAVAGVTATGKATTFRHARSTMYGAWQYSAPLPVLTLRPGESGYAVVAADDLPAGRQTTCPAPDVRLRVAAPGSTSSVLVSAWLPGTRTYLPTCPSITGSETGETSAITALDKLPH